MQDQNTQQVATRPNAAAEGGTGAAASSAAAQPALLPPVDILEDESGILLIADLPGVSKDRLGVRVDGETLVIEGSAAVNLPQQLEVVHSEVRQPNYRRSFSLSRELDTSKIEAQLRDGVLRLRIPKAEAAKPRRIEVQVA